MALTVQIIEKPATPSGESVIAAVTFDNIYTTGGLALSPSSLGLRSIIYLEAKQKGVASRFCEWNPATGKLLLFTALSTEAANDSDQSSIVVRVLAFGPFA